MTSGSFENLTRFIFQKTEGLIQVKMSLLGAPLHKSIIFHTV